MTLSKPAIPYIFQSSDNKKPMSYVYKNNKNKISSAGPENDSHETTQQQPMNIEFLSL